MILGLTWLVVFQLVGEVVVRVLDVPVPGPVVGMLLLFCLLRLRSYDEGPIVRAGTALLRHLQLFFVPAGVGVVAYLALLGREAVPITVAMLGSWVLGLLVVAWTAVALERLLGKRRDDLGEPPLEPPLESSGGAR
ncbi:CidA/LrgA family protein [Nocardioides sp. zg-536]|uniref:CidA/LrgA family protein n=1 Tax=Nocardioides faecalis TaxID=2803858 RepID=A0A938YAT4_9ACTN|nr:CidA/LrgA family protein [Nocardioides faecalis]MBM9460965.1 CidA/LrgA family protein [Nocardioides faecalis]MBS4751956.1 CidA/LrgA family protein [Nocardioides faecalis]QVI59212.1 CidA/LrgA family protein [Nocardioides faecalis]